MKFSNLALALFAGIVAAKDAEIAAPVSTAAAVLGQPRQGPGFWSTLTTTLIIVQPPAPSQTTATQTSTQKVTMTMTVAPTSTKNPVVTTTLVVTADPTAQEKPSKSTVTMTITVKPPTTATVTQTVTLKPPPPPATTSTAAASSIVTAVTITQTETAAVTKVTSTLKPNQPVAVYKRFTCSSQVKCASGSSYYYDNGSIRKCVSTYYDNVLASSTCVREHCCTPENKLEIVTVTDCKSQKVNCGNNMQLALDKSGNYVPCMITRKGNSVVSSTCKRDTCCVPKVQVVTSTQTVIATMVTTVTVDKSKRVNCSQLLKCKVYKKDSKGRMMKCIPGHAKQGCSFKRCCKK